MPAREVLARLAHAARAQRGMQPGARALSEEGAVQRGGQSRLLRHPRRERGIRAGGGGCRDLPLRGALSGDRQSVPRVCVRLHSKHDESH